VPEASDLTVRDRVLEATYACVARYGLGKTTVEDIVKESGVSRASIYRYFPGGRDELFRETVAWESARFLDRLAEAVAGAPDLSSLVEGALQFGHRAVLEHDVLQKVLATEPERLLPLLTTDHRLLRFAVAFLRPYVEREAERGGLQPGVDPGETAEFIGRMLLSLAASPGGHDLTDVEVVKALVRDQILAGVVTF
jgi:AcrR family transcriptional regulator